MKVDPRGFTIKSAYAWKLQKISYLEDTRVDGVFQIQGRGDGAGVRNLGVPSYWPQRLLAIQKSIAN